VAARRGVHLGLTHVIMQFSYMIAGAAGRIMKG